MDNTTLGLKYYVDMKDALLSHLSRQTNIKTDNQLMIFSDSSWKYFSENGRSKGAYIFFYKVGPMDHCTHIPGPVDPSSAESEYNEAYTSGMAVAHFRVSIHEFLNKYIDIITEEAPLIILDRKSAVCMAKNFRDNNHTRHIARRVHFEEW